MKKISLSLILLTMSQLANAFTVGTQNLYHWNTRMEERQEHLTREFNAGEMPEILGFQEAARWVGKVTLFDHFMQMSGYKGIYTSTNNWGVMNEAVALVSKLPSENLIELKLPKTQVHSRQSMNAGVFTTEHGKVMVINVHFSPFSKNLHRRIAQSKFVLEYAAKHSHLPIVIVGDLNDAYDSEVLKLFKDAGFEDVLSGEQPTYDPFNNPLVKETKWGASRLDYVLYQPAKLELEAASLMCKDNWVSDHYGIKAQFSFKN